MALSAAYEKHPQHRIEIDAECVSIRVTLDGEILAQTTRGLKLHENNYLPVVYIPREDVHMERLVSSELSTHCPFKGDASYFRGRTASDSGTEAKADAPSEELAWSYETPFDQMEAIRGHLAFYADRVRIESLTD